MKKEIIICIVVVIGVIVLNILTGNYTKESVESIKNELYTIKENINSREEENVIYEKIQDLKYCWNNRYETLSYYIEHNELEKVNLYIVGLESGINTKEYNQAIEELDKCVFTLEHIEDKYSFRLNNIF